MDSRWVFWAKIQMRPRKYDFLEIEVSNFGDFDFLDFLPVFLSKFKILAHFGRKIGTKSKNNQDLQNLTPQSLGNHIS